MIFKIKYNLIGMAIKFIPLLLFLTLGEGLFYFKRRFSKIFMEYEFEK